MGRKFHSNLLFSSRILLEKGTQNSHHAHENSILSFCGDLLWFSGQNIICQILNELPYLPFKWFKIRRLQLFDNRSNQIKIFLTSWFMLLYDWQYFNEKYLKNWSNSRSKSWLTWTRHDNFIDLSSCFFPDFHVLTQEHIGHNHILQTTILFNNTQGRFVFQEDEMIHETEQLLNDILHFRKLTQNLSGGLSSLIFILWVIIIHSLTPHVLA